MNTLPNALARVAAIALLILCIPFFGMWFNLGFDWTFSDFLIMFILIFGTGSAYTLVVRSSSQLSYRIGVGAAAFTGFFLVWSNLAVGLIGSENNLINLWYFGVLGVAAAGSFLARFRTRGMFWAMTATGAAQMAVAGYALLTGAQHLPESSVVEILGVNLFFTGLWLGTALVFHYAEQEVLSPES